MEDSSTNCLISLQKVYSEGLINDDIRDKTKDLIFDEDSTMLALFERYSDHSDVKELALQIQKYTSSDGLDGSKKPLNVNTDIKVEGK